MSDNSAIFSDRYRNQLNMKPTSKQIVSRIRAKGRGWVFTPKDFLDLGNRAAVDQAVSRLAKDGAIRRLKRGLYDFPRKHPKLGILTPSADNIASAIARKSGGHWQVSSSRAANAVGLTTQVPAKPVYFINGSSRKVVIGNQVINFHKGSARKMLGAGTPAGTVLQALDYFGKDGINKDMINYLANNLADRDIATLQKYSSSVPDWKRNVIDRISNPG